MDNYSPAAQSHRPRRSTRKGRSRLLAGWILAAGLPIVGVACAQQAQNITVVQGRKTGVWVPPESMKPSVIPAGWEGQATQAQPIPVAEKIAAPAEPVAQRLLPITLDTLLRLAEEQNPQVAIARARIEEACASKDLADQQWLPKLSVGTSIYRHEGGIANETGSLTHSSFGSAFAGLDLLGRLDCRETLFQQISAERQIWQQKGEMRKVTTEVLLKAASTYIDLLAARTGEAIAIGVQKDLEDLLHRAEKIVEAEPGSAVQVAQIQAQMKAREQIIAEMREQASRASAELVYLLGLDPATVLAPVQERLVPLEIVDATLPVEELIAQAQTKGPGIPELQGLLNVIHEGMATATGSSKYWPTLELRILEGGFGTGPGDNLTWDNRLDVGFQARWDISQFCTQNERIRVGKARQNQAELTFVDLKAKLAAGVKESRDSILGGREQIRIGEQAINAAQRANRLSDLRLKDNAPGSSMPEVLQSLQTVALARIGYLAAVRSYNKAQLRLLILTGSVLDSKTTPAATK